jgi:hypothetical protein
MTNEVLNDFIEEIKNEVFDFYNVEVNDEIVKDFIKDYYLSFDDDYDGYRPFTDDGVPLFDTAEREDFMYYLEDLGII